MSKIYTAAKLAELTDMPDLPEFIRKRKSGLLAVFSDVLGQEESLESVVTHKPAPSSAQMDFDYDDNLLLRYMFHGVGHEILLDHNGHGNYTPARVRYIIENGNPNLWAVGEYDLKTEQIRYFSTSVITDILAQMVPLSSVGTLDLSEDAKVFADKIEQAESRSDRWKLANELLSSDYGMGRDRRDIAHNLRTQKASNAEKRIKIALDFKLAATTPRPASPQYNPVPAYLAADALKKQIEPVAIFGGDLTKHVCKQIQNIRDLQAGEFLQMLSLVVDLKDDRKNLGRVANAFIGPSMLQEMVLKSAKRPRSAPALQPEVA